MYYLYLKYYLLNLLNNYLNNYLFLVDKFVDLYFDLLLFEGLNFLNKFYQILILLFLIL